jgi:hypothetical protein
MKSRLCQRSESPFPAPNGMNGTPRERFPKAKNLWLDSFRPWKESAVPIRNTVHLISPKLQGSTNAIERNDPHDRGPSAKTSGNRRRLPAKDAVT